jgi:hypothetical protein
MTRHSDCSWEFFTTLDYEWGVIRGRRPYQWTIVVRTDTFTPVFRFLIGLPSQIYSVTRVATLVTLILILFRMDVTIPFNCQVYRFHNLSPIHPRPDRPRSLGRNHHSIREHAAPDGSV